jgi:hypothetical protein
LPQAKLLVIKWHGCHFITSPLLLRYYCFVHVLPLRIYVPGVPLAASVA